MSRELQLFDGSGRVITRWHPGWEDARREIMFDIGYNPDSTRRGRPTPILQSGSETFAKNRDRLKSMADARDAVTYDWIGGVMARIVLYVAGKIHANSQTGEEEIDQAYDDYFHGWCGDEQNEDETTRCDLSGRHRLSKQIQMALMAFLVDGDHGFVEVAPEFSPTGEFCLQNIEADRIGSPIDSSTLENYIGGFTIDVQTGRIATARIYRRTRAGQYVEGQDVPYGSFIHVFDPERSDEYRGRTKLLRLLNDMRDIREWIEAEKIAGKTQAQWAALIGTKDPFNNTGPGAWTGQTADGTPTQDAQWGKILKMGEGENFSMLSPSARPSGAFMAFVQTLIRKMAVSLGLSYGFLWDLATLGGVSQRIEVQSDLRRIEYWQQNILVNKILNRVRRKVIAQGIAFGILNAHPLWKKCSWNFGPFITADLGHEMEADIQSITMGITKIEDITAKYGSTPKEVFDANAKVANQAISSGTEAELPVEAFATGLFPNLTNQKAAFMTPAPIPPPPAGSIEAIGDKGVAKLTEILIAVGEGKMDRESGVNSLVSIFGIPRGKAEKMVPEEPSTEDKNRAAGLDVKGRHPEPSPVVAAPNTSSSKKSKAKTNGSRK